MQIAVPMMAANKINITRTQSIMPAMKVSGCAGWIGLRFLGAPRGQRRGVILCFRIIGVG